MKNFSHQHYMQICLAEARKAMQNGEVPVGACLVRDGDIIALSGNRCEELGDPLAHAEMIIMQSIPEKYAYGVDLYVTLEPCSMCAAAIAWKRVERVIFGAYDPKSGGVIHGAEIFRHSHHKPEVIGGILEEDCQKILQDFFADKR